MKRCITTFLLIAATFSVLSGIAVPKSAHAQSVSELGIGPFGGVVVGTTRCSISCGSFWRGRVYHVLLTPSLVTVNLYVSNRARVYDYGQRSSGTFVLGKSKLDPRQFTCARRSGWKCRSVPAVAWVTDIGSSKTTPSLADIAELAQEFLEEFLETVIDSFQAALEQLAEIVVNDLATEVEGALGADYQTELEDIIDNVLNDTATEVFNINAGDPTEDLLGKIGDLLPGKIGDRLKDLLGENVADQIDSILSSVFDVVVQNGPSVPGSNIAVDPVPDLRAAAEKVRNALSYKWL